MRYLCIVATVVALLLIACDGPEKPTAGTGPEDTQIETPEQSKSSTAPAPVTRKRLGNTIIETPEYTGVIFSEKRASEFSFILDKAYTEFWEPSISDISRAEKCIRQHLVSVQQDPDSYQKEHAAYILENLGEYRRQYVGIVVDGEKRIWTNSFYFDDGFQNWEHDPVYVIDGGNHYWQIEYDLLRDECINFHVHGEA